MKITSRKRIRSKSESKSRITRRKAEWDCVLNGRNEGALTGKHLVGLLGNDFENPQARRAIHSARLRRVTFSTRLESRRLSTGGNVTRS